ncbi:DUF2637 domain-containing protein [Nocardia sp. NPDC052001]|uniref:DUF2637 domain-containing protein n=1 Tax=Nocardia sp. NPDC052001 TaxID=3154853 RepID=UPI00343B44C8
MSAADPTKGVAAVAPTGRELSPPETGHTVTAGKATAGDTEATTGLDWNVAEAVALLAVAAVSVAAFGWSAIALHGLAQAAGIPSWLAWGAPVIVDGPIIQSAFALVTLRRREKANVVIPKGTYGFFWGELAAAEAISLVGNAAHASMIEGKVLNGFAAAAVAGAAPIAALAVTHALTTLLEVPRTAEASNQAAAAEKMATAPVAPVSQSVARTRQSVAGDSEGDDSGDTDATAGDSDATPPGPEATPERDAYIWEQSQAGLSTRDIGKLIGLHHGTVAKVVARFKASNAITESENGGDAHVLSIIR